MKKNLLISIAVFSLMMITAGAAQTETAEGAQTTVQNGNQTADTSGAGNVSVEAGAVSQVDVDQSSLTDKWAGFYGQISATRVLGSSSGDLYTWTASTLSDAKVLTTPIGAPTPSTLSNVDDPSAFLDNAYGSNEFSSGVANASGTFNQTDQVSVLSQTVSNTPFVNTYDSNGDRSDRFTTFLTNNTAASSDSPVFIAEGNNDVTGFTGSDLNYQMLVGVGETASERGYSFYLALP
jgi:hypothetical protein